jgi:ankyrin repeat protein
MKDGFAWACEFGKTAVAKFFLDRGMKLDGKLKNHGQTGLHWAACGGNIDTVDLLLERGAPVNATDATHNATPLS